MKYSYIFFFAFKKSMFAGLALSILASLMESAEGGKKCF
jgi:hypothetical protein